MIGTVPQRWKFCPACGKRLIRLTPENRGVAPLPDVREKATHDDGTMICGPTPRDSDATGVPS